MLTTNEPVVPTWSGGDRNCVSDGNGASWPNHTVLVLGCFRRCHRKLATSSPVGVHAEMVVSTLSTVETPAASSTPAGLARLMASPFLVQPRSPTMRTSRLRVVLRGAEAATLIGM